MIGRIAVTALLLAEAFAMATLAELIAASYSGAEHHAVAAWAFCITAIAGFVVPRFVESFEMPPRSAYAITAWFGLVIIYVLVRITVAESFAFWDFGWVAEFLRNTQSATDRGGHAIMGAVLLLITWARSTMRAADEVEMEMIPRAVTLPFTFVTILVVLGAASDRSGEIGRAGAAFYVMAIVALACSQLAMSGATFGEMKAGGTAGILLAGTAAAAVIGLLLIGLFVSLLGPTLGPIISTAVEWTLTIILTPFAWVLTAFFELLFRGASPLPDIQQAVVDRSQQAGNPDQGDPSTASKVGVFFMRTVALIVLIGVAAFFATVFARLRNRRNVRLDDGRETSTVGDLRGDLGSMFRSLFRRGPAHPPGTATTEATRLYLEVLSSAEAAGHAKTTGETAREFAPTLNQTFANPVTDDITKAFESARYAGREPDARAIAELRSRWQRERS